MSLSENMGKDFTFKDRSCEKYIQALSLEKRLEQHHKSKLTLIENARNGRMKDMETKTCDLKYELASYGRGMTNLSSYFEKELVQSDQNIIWYPLIRSKEDWEPRPCWIGQAAVNSKQCRHFPCRTLTSYHFIYRQLPQFINKRAEESVRRSRMNVSPAADTDTRSIVSGQLGDNVISSNISSPRPQFDMPSVEFPDDMTAKERKLKLIIRKKRIQNELENKPPDRSVNYGKPTPVRRLQRPVRPVVRRMDIR